MATKQNRVYMKQMIIFFLLFPIIVFSQDTLRAKTIIDSFDSKSGQFIEKEYYSLGKIDKAEVTVLKVTDLTSNQSLYGLHFQLANYSVSTGSGTVYNATLDEDEIDGLIAAFRYIDENVFRTKPGNTTEFNYTSRGDFKAGCFWTARERKWRIYLQLDKYRLGSNIGLESKDDLKELIKIFENSTKKIQALKNT